MTKPTKKPAKVTPPKGFRVTKTGGILNSGGSWPNSGRPSSQLRALAQSEMTKHELIPHLAKLGKEAQREGDQINAITAIARIAIPNQLEVGENPETPLLTDAERKARLTALGLG